jgi:hypothetical protein
MRREEEREGERMRKEERGGERSREEERGEGEPNGKQRIARDKGTVKRRMRWVRKNK